MLPVRFFYHVNGGGRHTQIATKVMLDEGDSGRKCAQQWWGGGRGGSKAYLRKADVLPKCCGGLPFTRVPAQTSELNNILLTSM